MKRLLVALVLCGMMLPALAQDVKPKPLNLTMTLACVLDSGEPKQYVFVIGAVAFKTLDGLKNCLRGLPQGSSLTWSPGCGRFGGEPLLNSEADMKEFRKFCESAGIKLILAPSA